MFKEFCEGKEYNSSSRFHTLQQNGIMERKNRILLDMVRPVMARANLLAFGGMLTAAYILNRVPSKSVPATPYDLWHGRNPFLARFCP